MKFAKLILVVVIIRRPKDRAAHAALSDKRVCAFWPIDFRSLGLVKCGEMFVDDVANCFVLRNPDSFVQRANVERLERFAFGVFLRGQGDVVPLGLLQNHLGDVEQRVGAPCHLDLARQ